MSLESKPRGLTGARPPHISSGAFPCLTECPCCSRRSRPWRATSHQSRQLRRGTHRPSCKRAKPSCPRLRSSSTSSRRRQRIRRSIRSLEPTLPGWTRRRSRTTGSSSSYPGPAQAADQFLLIQHLGARLGYHVIGLSFPTSPGGIAKLCPPTANAAACYENARLELLDGIDRTTVVSVNPPTASTTDSSSCFNTSWRSTRRSSGHSTSMTERRNGRSSPSPVFRSAEASPR